MRQREYAWPEGHWDWYRHLAFQHGVRCGDFIFIGGQVDKTSSGEPCNAFDLQAQTAVVVRHIARVLSEFDADVTHLTRLIAYYATDGEVDERALVTDVGRHLQALGLTAAGPVIVPVPLPFLALPGMRVEIEAVAVLPREGAGVERVAAGVSSAAPLPAPFSHGLRVGEHVFIGARDAGPDPGEGPGSDAVVARAFAAVDAVLEALGTTPAALARFAVWHAGDAGAALRPGLLGRVEALTAAACVLPTPRLPPGCTLRLEGWAVDTAHRKAVRTPAQWCWPHRGPAVQSVAAGDLVFVSAQLPLDRDGLALHPGDLNTQTRLSMTRTAGALAEHGLGLDHMLRQTSFYLGNADPADIVTNQRLRSSHYTEPAGASTGVPLVDFGETGAMVSIETIAAR